MKSASKTENLRKICSLKTHLNQFTEQEIAFFTLCRIFCHDSVFLYILNQKKILHIDLDVSKKFEFNAIIYHVKGNVSTIIKKSKEINIIFTEYSVKLAIQLILFLSYLLKNIDIKY